MPQFALHCDGLLGLDSLIAHDISVHPKRRAILSDKCFHPAMDVNYPFLSSISFITPCVDQRLSTYVTPAPLPGSSEEKSSSSELCAVSAVVNGDQYIGPSCATRLSVRLKNAPVGSHVISTPESMLIHHLCLESTLSAVHSDHISDAIVTNKTGSSITLKDGVLLDTFEVLDLSSTEKPLPLPVAGLQQLSLIFQKLTQVGLKSKLTKCEFLKSRIEFLGHLIDGDGIHTVDSKITAVQKFPTPKSVENVRSFLGLDGYYRAFVKKFASIASPLTRLLKKNVPFHWNDTRQHSSPTLKDSFTHAPILKRCSTTQFHYSKRRSYSCTNSSVPRLQVAFYHVHGRFRPWHRCCSHADRRR